MKINLTNEQSQRLIELGVDPSKASKREIVHDPNPQKEYIATIFTFIDILSLLPKEIEVPDYWGEVDTCSLSITTNNDVWKVSYYGVDNVFRKAPELIDALFELLVWVLQNHPNKIKKPRANKSNQKTASNGTQAD